MSKMIHVLFEVRIPDDADPDSAAGAVFDQLHDFHSSHVESVDGYSVEYIEGAES